MCSGVVLEALLEVQLGNGLWRFWCLCFCCFWFLCSFRRLCLICSSVLLTADTTVCCCKIENDDVVIVGAADSTLGSVVGV